MESYSSLLFELSSTDRLDILMLIKKSPLKLSHISNKLDFTVQETSRNMTRLSEAQLIRKDAEGAFHLTPYGEEALNLLSGFRFLFRNREYFLTHSLERFPQEFRASLGILDKFDYVNEVMVAFHNTECMIEKAEKFVWILTDQILVSTLPLLIQELERGGEFKLLMPKDYSPSGDILKLVGHPVFGKAARTRILENRFLDHIDVFLCLSEKETAMLSFPNTTGKLDYIGFKSEDKVAVEWSKMLFTYYWNRASSEVPQPLIESQR